MTQAFPLQWPMGKRRTASPKRSRFDTRTIEVARRHLQHEIALLGGNDAILSTNLKLRLDGMPYSDQRQPADKGAAVYFKYNGKQMCFACDAWETIEENIYAVAKTIEALRGIERWGSGDMMQQAFTGFIALPSAKRPEDVLGVRDGASHDEIETAYRAMAKIWHPDKLGGSQEKMQEINEARRRLLA